MPNEFFKTNLFVFQFLGWVKPKVKAKAKVKAKVRAKTKGKQKERQMVNYIDFYLRGPLDVLAPAVGLLTLFLKVLGSLNFCPVLTKLALSYRLKYLLQAVALAPPFFKASDWSE